MTTSSKTSGLDLIALRSRARHLARELGRMLESGLETDRVALRTELASVEAAIASLTAA